ncbi:hypothetical protein PM082_014464 [Marasmius tenuissimus]|nr:hypothetical protein PM082_014464 [Marasmius tenuissimus]
MLEWCGVFDVRTVGGNKRVSPGLVPGGEVIVLLSDSEFAEDDGFTKPVDFTWFSDRSDTSVRSCAPVYAA